MAEYQGNENTCEQVRIQERNRTLDWTGIDAEKLRALRQSRSASKGSVTKALNDVRNLMRDCKNIALVKEKLENVKVTVDNFHIAHDAYHRNLTDELTIEESNEYAEIVNQSMTDIINEVDRWIACLHILPSEKPSPATRQLPSVKSEDSISNVGSRASTKLSRHSGSKVSRASAISAAKAKATAKRAALEAGTFSLQDLEEIQIWELKLQFKRKQLELKTELAKAHAEELAYSEAESSQVGNYLEFHRIAKPKGNSAASHADFAQPKWHSRVPENPPTNSIQWSSLAPTAATYLPKVEKYTEFKEHVPLDHPIIKNETHKHKPDDSVHIDSITHSLLEAQQQQNYRLQELVLRQQESALALTLPQPEVPTFTGNPMEYWTFIRAFENLIENKTLSHSARLYYLVQYTSGEVKELVRSCLAMREDVSYLEAKNLLRKRYGQSYRMANAFAEKLAKGSAIKTEDGDALRRFSTLLSSGRNTLKEIGYLNKEENPDTLKAIVGRLPYDL